LWKETSYENDAASGSKQPVCPKSDTGGEVIAQAWDGEMFTLNTSTFLDFATSIF